MAKRGKTPSRPSGPKVRLPKKMGGGAGKTWKVLIGAGIFVIVLLGVWYGLFRPEKIDYTDPEYTWQVRRDDPAGDLLVRGKKLDRIKDDPQALIRALNKSEKDPESFRTPKDREPVSPPKLKLKGIKNHTAFVEVINAEYLTQRLGSSGAEEFLAVATYTLTENKDIQVVQFLFEEGDHAVPGPYTRKYFLKNWKVAP
jgi:hypothetical protein